MIINPYIYGVATSYDPDAQLFFNAQSGAGVTLTTTQMNATNQWVVDAKAANIWTKFKAIYPVVGGTATAHKFNLKNPLDTDAAFRLAFVGGWTHSVNGALPNGTNAYADTYYFPSVNGTLNSSHISFYSRTDSDNGGTDISANNAIGTQGMTILYTRSGNNLYGTIDKFANTTPDFIQFSNTNSLGFYTLSRTASNLSKGYKNGSLLNTSTLTGSPTNRSLFLSATNKDNPVQVTQYSNRQCAFASIGDGLTDAEVAAFRTAVQNFQTTLGRQV